MRFYTKYVFFQLQSIVAETRQQVKFMQNTSRHILRASIENEKLFPCAYSWTNRLQLNRHWLQFTAPNDRATLLIVDRFSILCRSYWAVWWLQYKFCCWFCILLACIRPATFTIPMMDFNYILFTPLCFDGACCSCVASIRLCVCFAV